jgi:hypothetical protein
MQYLPQNLYLQLIQFLAILTQVHLKCLIVVPIMYVAVINIKRLIDEMHYGEILPPVKPLASRDSAANIARNISSDRLTSNVHLKLNPALDMLKKAFPTHQPQDIAKPAQIPEELKSPSTPSLPHKENRGTKPDESFVPALFSCMMSWGTDQQLDDFCSNELRLSKAFSKVVGSKGASGYLSFPIADASSSDWSYSSFLSGQRCVTLIALVRSLSSSHSYSQDAVFVMRQIASITPAGLHTRLYSPSLSLMIKFWQDSIRKNINTYCSGCSRGHEIFSC